MCQHPNLLNRRAAALIVIDIQERLAAVMSEREQVVEATKKLINAFQEFGLPVFYSEQYPQGLGHTETPLWDLLSDTEPMSKMCFSSCRDTDVVNRLKDVRASQIVLAGMETHVCVFQTAMDLLANGFQVFIAREAVTSRKPLDRDIALDRMKQNGITVTTVEAILFELLEKSSTPEFKKLHALIK